MKERVQIPDFQRLWTEHVAASTKPRMNDDQAEQDFWKEFIKTKTYAPEPYSRLVMDYLTPLLASFEVDSALEFGPGWGNYTLDLARMCTEVACVDISQDVLDFIVRTGAEHGFHNLSTCHSKWETYTPERKYDLVFGYNCFYRQADLAQCFAKMNRASKKLCVVGMTTGLAPQWVHEMVAAGGSTTWEWKDYIYFVGILYQMGIDANVRVIPYDKELVYPDADAMVRGELSRCGVSGIDHEQAKQILSKHFTCRPDGSLYGCAHFRCGVVWWPTAEDLAADEISGSC